MNSGAKRFLLAAILVAAVVSCFTALAIKLKLRHALTMQLTLPEAIESRVTPRAAALGLAIGMFVTEEATLGQAAEIAGLSQAELLKELGRRRIPIHYGPEELVEDLKTVAALSA